VIGIVLVLAGFVAHARRAGPVFRNDP
jgi:hypothetical protein